MLAEMNAAHLKPKGIYIQGNSNETVNKFHIVQHADKVNVFINIRYLMHYVIPRSGAPVISFPDFRIVTVPSFY